jgi:hypothetical protein
MGYTSYISNMPKKHEQNRWNMFVEAVKHVYSELPKHSESAGGYYKTDPLIICGPNGYGEHFSKY